MQTMYAERQPTAQVAFQFDLKRQCDKHFSSRIVSIIIACFHVKCNWNKTVWRELHAWNFLNFSFTC